MKTLDPLFARLAKSTFRSRFRLGQKERQYCLDKGAPVIEQHAADFMRFPPMMENRLLCVVTRYLLLNMLRRRAVEGVWRNGMIYLRV